MMSATLELAGEPAIAKALNVPSASCHLAQDVAAYAPRFERADWRHDAEALVRHDYERCHPEDTFEDLKRRARFTKEDKGLLRDWLALRSAQRDPPSPPSERGEDRTRREP
jgi:hypothetical protein